MEASASGAPAVLVFTGALSAFGFYLLKVFPALGEIG